MCTLRELNEEHNEYNVGLRVLAFETQNDTNSTENNCNTKLST